MPLRLREHADALLAAVAAELPLDPAARASLALDEHNECFLTLQDRIVVMFYLDEAAHALMLNLPIGSLPSDGGREAVMLELLSGNYVWQLTEGGTLGIDRATDVITLGYLVPLPLAHPEQMPRIVEKLASVADHWMRLLAERAPGAPAAAPAGAPVSQGFRV